MLQQPLADPVASPDAPDDKQWSAPPTVQRPSHVPSDVLSSLPGTCWLLLTALVGAAIGVGGTLLVVQQDLKHGQSHLPSPSPSPPPPPPPPPAAHSGGTSCPSLALAAHAASRSIGYSGNDIYGAINYINSRGGAAAGVVCPLANMTSEVPALDGEQPGTVIVKAGQMLAIASATMGSSMPTAPPSEKMNSSRLWARFDVNGTLIVVGVTIRDRAISPNSGSDQLGAAAHVFSSGRLVATGVSFLRLVSTLWGGAVVVESGGMAEFYGCLFDGCKATNDCCADGSTNGNGGAISFEAGASGIIARSLLRSSSAGCMGGAMQLRVDNQHDPFKTNVTITRTTFTDNHYGNHKYGNGEDIYVSPSYHLDVPCPEPGSNNGGTCNVVGCCVDGDREILSVTLPCN